MSGISRLGDALAPHVPFGPQSIVEGSDNVFTNGIPTARVGDAVSVHCDSNGNCHDSTISDGNSSVLVNGLPVAYVGSNAACGSIVIEGSSDVFAG